MQYHCISYSVLQEFTWVHWCLNRSIYIHKPFGNSWVIDYSQENIMGTYCKNSLPLVNKHRVKSKINPDSTPASAIRNLQVTMVKELEQCRFTGPFAPRSLWNCSSPWQMAIPETLVVISTSAGDNLSIRGKVTASTKRQWDQHPDSWINRLGACRVAQATSALCSHGRLASSPCASQTTLLIPVFSRRRIWYRNQTTS